jgi:hypothetical protein
MRVVLQTQKYLPRKLYPHFFVNDGILFVLCGFLSTTFNLVNLDTCNFSL